MNKEKFSEFFFDQFFSYSKTRFERINIMKKKTNCQHQIIDEYEIKRRMDDAIFYIFLIHTRNMNWKNVINYELTWRVCVLCYDKSRATKKQN